MDELTVTTKIDINVGMKSLLPAPPLVLNDVVPDGVLAPLVLHPPGGTKAIEITPSAAGAGGARAVALVLVSANSYDPKITYTVEGTSVANPAAAAASAGLTEHAFPIVSVFTPIVPTFRFA